MEQIECCVDVDYLIDSSDSVISLRLPSLSQKNCEFLCTLSSEDIVYNLGTNIYVDEKMTYFTDKRSSVILFVKSNPDKSIMIMADSSFFSMYIETSKVGKKKLIIRVN